VNKRFFGCCFLLCTLWLPADGTRHSLRTGVLYISDTVELSAGVTDRVLHLHGASKVVEQNFDRTRHQAVLVNITLPGLSSVYRKHFDDPAVFPALMNEVRGKLAAQNQGNEVLIRHLTLMSFSAGFGGVRELLKQSGAVERIDALVMADSLYSGFTGDPENRKVNPVHLTPFLEYARMAANGKKQMVLSHTQLFTPHYASTKETADYLIRGLGGERELKTGKHSAGLTELSRYRKGRFLLMGFEGETGEDHMNHLRSIHLFLNEIRT